VKKRKIYWYIAFCFTLLFFMVPDVGAGWEEMEVLKDNFDIDTTPRQQWYPHVVYNPIENEFMGVWRTDGVLRIDCDPDDQYECINNFAEINGRRISPEGELLGDLLQWSPAELGFKMIPRIDHNVFTNEYIVGFSNGTTYTDTEIYIGRVNSAGDVVSMPESLYEGGEGAGHINIVFNPDKREYLVLYNDRHIFNDYQNNVGFILNENGDPVHGPFEVGNQLGDMYAPSAAYNPTNNTYLVVWEDFRHVDDWMYDPCDAYGALLDANGNMIAEIPVMDDYFDNNGMPGGADQRVPVPVYNPDKNEFLVAWRDDRPTLDNYGIMGRFIDPDGTPKGPEFVLLDGPGMQGTIEMHYLEEEKKYFATWTDTRNAIDPGMYYFISDNADIYARWFDDTGSPIGDEIPICLSPDVQQQSEMAYNPVMKRFLITWYDKNPVDDYEIPPDMPIMFGPSPSDVKGTIYGAPSFLSGRVIDRAGNPVEDAWALVIGPSLPALKKTNIGGWFNIGKKSQAEGTYLVVAFKLGYPIGIQLVNYTGDPLKATMEMNKR